MILEDNIAHHPKFLLAGQLIGGPAGASRALALWVAAIGYARAGLTNGVVHDAFVTKFALDSDPKKVANALSSRRVRLFHRVKGGYKVHDFTEYNGTADKLRYQRELAKARKRRQRAKEPVENLLMDKARHDVTRDIARDITRDSRARDLEKEKEKEYVRTDRGVRATALVCVPTETERAVPQTARDTPAKRAARAPADDGNYAVLEKLAHTVLDELHTADPENPEVVETLKVKCAQLAINYATDPQIVRRALASAATQRRGPLQPLVDKMRAALANKTIAQTARTFAGARRR